MSSMMETLAYPSLRDTTITGIPWLSKRVATVYLRHCNHISANLPSRGNVLKLQNKFPVQVWFPLDVLKIEPFSCHFSPDFWISKSFFEVRSHDNNALCPLHDLPLAICLERENLTVASSIVRMYCVQSWLFFWSSRGRSNLIPRYLSGAWGLYLLYGKVLLSSVNEL